MSTIKGTWHLRSLEPQRKIRRKCFYQLSQLNQTIPTESPWKPKVQTLRFLSVWLTFLIFLWKMKSKKCPGSFNSTLMMSTMTPSFSTILFISSIPWIMEYFLLLETKKFSWRSWKEKRPLNCAFMTVCGKSKSTRDREFKMTATFSGI